MKKLIKNNIKQLVDSIKGMSLVGSKLIQSLKTYMFFRRNSKEHKTLGLGISFSHYLGINKIKQIVNSFEDSIKNTLKNENEKIDIKEFLSPANWNEINDK